LLISVDVEDDDDGNVVVDAATFSPPLILVTFHITPVLAYGQSMAWMVANGYKPVPNAKRSVPAQQQML